MISNLPNDLIEEILVRVPATSLGISRSTCTRWNALVKDPSFIKKHFDKAPRQPLIVTLRNRRVYSMSFSRRGVEFTRKLRLIDCQGKSEVAISKVFCCGSLLLCTTMDHRPVVCNPCTGQTMWIESSTPYTNFDICALGYVNNESGRTYKILRQINSDLIKVHGDEIYDFGSGLWRVIRDDFSPYHELKSHGVSLKGNTYWLATSNQVVIISFNFSTERTLLLPSPCEVYCSGYGVESLAVVREEQLAVLCWTIEKRKMKIWVSTKIDTTDVLWSTFLKVDLDDISYFELNFSGFFINYDKEFVVRSCENSGIRHHYVYIIGDEEDKFRKVSADRSSDLSRHLDPFTYYVPSLVRF